MTNLDKINHTYQLFINNKINEAINCLNQIKDSSKVYDFNYLMALCYLKKKNPFFAFNFLQKELYQFPNNIKAKLLLNYVKDQHPEIQRPELLKIHESNYSVKEITQKFFAIKNRIGDQEKTISELMKETSLTFEDICVAFDIFNHIYQNENQICKKLSSCYSIGNKYKRIYNIHIEKTGGTSLNEMFLSLGGEKGSTVYTRVNSSIAWRTISNKKIFVGWNKKAIEEGNYFYAFSHLPFHSIELPPNTFTITCLRDPASRIISAYKETLYYIKNNYDPKLIDKKKWIGKSFKDFILALPKYYLLNQLYMFSNNIEIDEAYKKITSCSHFFFTENFSEGIHELNKKIGTELKPIHARKAINSDIHISDEDISLLKEMVQPEYVLLKKLKRFKQQIKDAKC